MIQIDCFSFSFLLFFFGRVFWHFLCWWSHFFVVVCTQRVRLAIITRCNFLCADRRWNGISPQKRQEKFAIIKISINFIFLNELLYFHHMLAIIQSVQQQQFQCVPHAHPTQQKKRNESRKNRYIRRTPRAKRCQPGYTKQSMQVVCIFMISACFFCNWGHNKYAPGWVKKKKNDKWIWDMTEATDSATSQ